MPNIKVLEPCNITSVEVLITQAQLRWAGHVLCMEEHRISKALMSVELASGKRVNDTKTGKATLKSYNIDPAMWEEKARNRHEWHKICHDG